VRFIVTDVSSNGFGVPWGHTRSYSNKLSGQQGGINGNSWFVAEVPELVEVNSTTICLISIVQEALWFDLVGGSWVPRFFVKDSLVQDAANHQFVYTNVETGIAVAFFDFSTSNVAAKRGQFKSFTDSGGHETVATYGTDDRIASFVMESGTNTAGYYYTYYVAGLGGHLQSGSTN